MWPKSVPKEGYVFFGFPGELRLFIKFSKKFKLKLIFKVQTLFLLVELHNLYSIMHKTAKSYYENCPILFPCELIEPFFRHRHHAAHHGRHRTIHLWSDIFRNKIFSLTRLVVILPVREIKSLKIYNHYINIMAHVLFILKKSQ